MILKFLVQMFVWMLVPFTDTVDMNLSKLQGTVEDRGAWCPCGCKELDVT